MRCHFVWCGNTLPYHARLAVESALVAMPDAEIHMHFVGPRAQGEHAAVVAGYPRVTVHDVVPADLFATCPGGPRPYLELLDRITPTSAAAVSNVVRLGVLHQLGGVYLDTDVIVVRGLHDPSAHGAFVGREHVWAGNRARVEGSFGPLAVLRSAPWALTWLARRADSGVLGGRARFAERLADRATRLQVNNAVIGAPAGSAFVTAALDRARFVDPAPRFALGPSLLDDVASREPACVRLVPPSRFFPVPPGQSYRLFEDVRLTLPVDTQVVHYVASNHRRLLATLGPGDRRFATRQAPFWRLGAEVQAAVAAGHASAGFRPAAPNGELRRAG